MKKQILFVATVALATSVLLINGCKKDDTTAPVVTPAQSTMTVTLGASQPADPGASTDDGSSVSSNWSSTNPNMSVAGNYTITYSATDGDGNTGTGSMTVRVKNDAEDYFSLNGTNYGTTETPCSVNCSWVQSIKASSTVNNEIVFGKFANYQGNSSIKGKIVTVGSSKFVILNPSPQTANGIGTDGCNHSFGNGSSNGSPLTQVGSAWGFSINFTDQVTNTGGSCVADPSPVPYTDSFLSQ
jgi:hypothetical protein